MRTRIFLYRMCCIFIAIQLKYFLLNAYIILATISAFITVDLFKIDGCLNLEAYEDVSMLPPIIECNDSCACKIDECINRVVQFGPQYQLDIFECEEKAKGTLMHFYM